MCDFKGCNEAGTEVNRCGEATSVYCKKHYNEQIDKIAKEMMQRLNDTGSDGIAQEFIIKKMHSILRGEREASKKDYKVEK